MVIYVGNIDRRSTEANVRSAFEAYGSVARVNLMGSFAFVEMTDDKQAQTAISDLNDQGGWVVRTLAAMA
jgi:RNA recognition motif-containing protein